eukprot:TRINITY_DN9537_c0_g1_i1.p1 TRINITY_DN9537_c0_g1~~TRINITY_DN9537_c0_g1_i1.p1  ORF type:complete len:112 (-),score=16.12 TRINITY_DN9537_c0_g1_i1:61-357(-)
MRQNLRSMRSDKFHEHLLKLFDNLEELWIYKDTIIPENFPILMDYIQKNKRFRKITVDHLYRFNEFRNLFPWISFDSCGYDDRFYDLQKSPLTSPPIF